MTYTIIYEDDSRSMISPNNPTSYEPSVDGIVKLSAPSLSRGEFRGWYTDSSFATQITQLDSTTVTHNLTIYAKVQVNTQLQILGGSISEIDSSSVNGKYILLTNSINASDSRSLYAITPSEYSELVSGSVEYIRANSGAVTVNSDSIRNEYFIDVGNQTSLELTVDNEESAKYIILHFTRGTNCTTTNIEFILTLTGITINSLATSYYNISIGSTLVLTKGVSDWSDGLYLNPTLSQISSKLINDSLSVRNYVYTGTESFEENNEHLLGGRKYINISLDDFNISQSDSNVLYKSILVQFDMSAYSASGADATTLNKKQGYFNLIDVQASALTYNSTTNEVTLTLTYDDIPAYSDNSLSAYTQDIPIRIMVVI